MAILSAALAVALVKPAIATEVPASSRILGGCQLGALNGDPYGARAKRLGIEGRVLAEIERTSEGRVRLVRIAISNPPGVFDRSVKSFVARFRCASNAEATRGLLSVTFSLVPGNGMPHFDGANEQIEVVGERLPR